MEGVLIGFFRLSVNSLCQERWRGRKMFQRLFPVEPIGSSILLRVATESLSPLSPWMVQPSLITLPHYRRLSPPPFLPFLPFLRHPVLTLYFVLFPSIPLRGTLLCLRPIFLLWSTYLRFYLFFLSLLVFPRFYDRHSRRLLPLPMARSVFLRPTVREGIPAQLVPWDWLADRTCRWASCNF